MGTPIITKQVTTRTPIHTAGSKKYEKTNISRQHDDIRVDEAVPEQSAGGDGVETLQQQYQRADQYQVLRNGNDGIPKQNNFLSNGNGAGNGIAD